MATNLAFTGGGGQTMLSYFFTVAMDDFYSG